MEVVVMLKDGRDLKIAEGLANRLGGSARVTREGAVNPDAPACNSPFDTGVWRCASSTSNQTAFSLIQSFILPHELLRATRLRKR